MISLKIIHTPFTHTTTQITMVHMIRSSRRHYFLSHPPRSKPDDGSGSDPDPNPSQGDTKKQELLVKIAMLQAEKVRLTDFLDERSAYLTRFAEDANAEFDAIGESALKDLDQAASRIMENIESQMQEFEESMRESKLEIEKSDKELADFEGEVVKSRNEGMFFQSLGITAPADEEVREKAKEEAKKISELTKQSAASKTRRNVYVALMGVVTIGISDSVFGTSVQDWKRIAVLSVILVGLLSQFIYEQMISSEAEKKQSWSSEKDEN